jgi:two-component system response regulator NreC
MPTRIVVCDDHALVREGLKLLLGYAVGVEVVGEAANGHEAVERVVHLRPDVALVDITMPELDGLAATRLIRRCAPSVKVLILTMHDDPECLAQAIDAGASGYLFKDSSGAELIDAIRYVILTDSFVASEAVRPFVTEYLSARKHARGAPANAGLTAREEDVLWRLADGWTSKEIADELLISVKTVDTHRSHILHKLNLRRRAELQRWVRTHCLRRQVRVAQPSVGPANAPTPSTVSGRQTLESDPRSPARRPAAQSTPV